jgi:hypothetical protein
MRVTAIALIILGLVTCGSANAQHQGENLLQPLPVPEEGWAMAQGRINGNEVVEWSRRKGRDRASTTIQQNTRDYSATRFHEISNQTGTNACAEFDSQVIIRTPVNGFDRMMWKASCRRTESDSLMTVLHLFIAGRDSGYYLTRTWLDEPDGESVDRWTEHFSSISVCDTRRRRGAPCPELAPVDRSGR